MPAPPPAAAPSAYGGARSSATDSCDGALSNCARAVDALAARRAIAFAPPRPARTSCADDRRRSPRRRRRPPARRAPTARSAPSRTRARARPSIAARCARAATAAATADSAAAPAARRPPRAPRPTGHRAASPRPRARRGSGLGAGADSGWNILFRASAPSARDRLAAAHARRHEAQRGELREQLVPRRPGLPLDGRKRSLARPSRGREPSRHASAHARGAAADRPVSRRDAAAAARTRGRRVPTAATMAASEISRRPSRSQSASSRGPRKPVVRHARDVGRAQQRRPRAPSAAARA